MGPPTPTLEEFLACCDTECAFLVREYGFERLPTPREYNEFSVRFRKGPLGVDVYGESWGQSASCELVLGEDRLYLGLMVPRAERGTPGRRRAPPGQLDQVRHIAGRLKRHAADFLGGDTTRFLAALAEWRRVTRPRPVSEEQRLEQLRLTAVTLAGHASRRGDHAEVVRLLEPYADSLSSRQRRMLETARGRRGGTPGS
jgi:hypothetical protein